jgi:hypothetical protein
LYLPVFFVLFCVLAFVFLTCTCIVTLQLTQIQVGAAEYAAEVFQLPMSVLLAPRGAEASSSGGGKTFSDTHLCLSPSSALKRTSSLFHPVSA